MTIPGVETPDNVEPAREAFSEPEARRIVVPGQPKPMPRMKVNRQTGFLYTPTKPQKRKGDFAAAWIDAGFGPFPREVPLAVEIEFVFPRPAGHYGTGKNAGLLKHSAVHLRPRGGTNGGDLDNLAKLVTDALEGVAYHNDSDIAALTLSKRYVYGAETPSTSIAIRLLLP